MARQPHAVAPARILREPAPAASSVFVRSLIGLRGLRQNLFIEAVARHVGGRRVASIARPPCVVVNFLASVVCRCCALVRMGMRKPLRIRAASVLCSLVCRGRLWTSAWLAHLAILCWVGCGGWRALHRKVGGANTMAWLAPLRSSCSWRCQLCGPGAMRYRS